MKMSLAAIVFVAFAWAQGLHAAEAPRVNQEGRALSPLPKFEKPVLFNTPEADAILAAMQIFPKENPWNEDVSKRPVHPNSEKIVTRIGKEKRIAYNLDMGFVLVPPNQPKIAVKMVSYGDESDQGPFPLPEQTPIENWPLEGGALEKIQREGEGDRHALVVDPFNGMLYEFYQGRKTDGGWQAACEATFDLKSNKLRPKGWTSSDAAGLPVFPAVARYDECERGMVEHALRFTVQRSKKEYLYPATHFASKLKDDDLPPMGMRFRLKASVDISKFSKHAQAIARGLQKYGMFMADNGGDWRISVAPDARLKGLEALKQLKGGDFEVIVSTGENEGPRAGGK